MSMWVEMVKDFEFDVLVACVSEVTAILVNLLVKIVIAYIAQWIEHAVVT